MPVKAREPIPETVYIEPVDINYLLTEKPKEISIELVDSPYSLKEKAEAEQKALSLRSNSPVQRLSGAKTGGYTIVSQYNRLWRNCVNYVRSVQPGYPQSGSAGKTPVFINSKTPSVGAVAVQAGHVMIVTAVHDGSVRVREAAYVSGYLTEREVPTSQILGYWR